MIVSHRHQFIFLKARKVAGTSIEMALSRVLGDDDTYAPNFLADESKMRAQIGGREPQNFAKPWRLVGVRDVARAVVKRRPPALSPHTVATDARTFVGASVWDSYFTFTVSRNPWDAVISHYWFVLGEGRLGDRGEDMSILEFLDTVYAQRLAMNRDFAMIDGEIAVDKICRYENLDADLAEVAASIGLRDRLELPRAKGSSRQDRRHYRDVLTEAEAEAIAAMFPFEVEQLGYSY